MQPGAASMRPPAGLSARCRCARPPRCGRARETTAEGGSGSIQCRPRLSQKATFANRLPRPCGINAAPVQLLRKSSLLQIVSRVRRLTVPTPARCALVGGRACASARSLWCASRLASRAPRLLGFRAAAAARCCALDAIRPNTDRISRPARQRTTATLAVTILVTHHTDHVASPRL